MDLSSGPLVASFAVSTVGLAFFLYGKKASRFPQLVVGLTMMVFPYFGTGALATWGIGAGLTTGLFVLLRLGM